MKTLSENMAFGGTQGVYSHISNACNCGMTLATYLPPSAKEEPVPVLWYLSGLTCTHENAMVKAGAQAMAAKRQAGTFRMQPGYDHSYFLSPALWKTI
jgi:S-formylglutathione hydrolase